MYNDELKIYRGDDYYITDKIFIRQPKITEICDFGEEKYLRMVSQLVSVPQNSIYMLSEAGIDFTKITDFQLFTTLCRAFKYEETKFIIPDLDFEGSRIAMVNKVTSKGTVLDTKEPAVIFKSGAVLNEKSYKKMASYIRKINRIQRPWFLTIGNESTKKRMIQSAKLEYETQLQNKGAFKSRFLPLISALSVMGFRNEVWNMKLYEFFETLERSQLKEQTSHLYDGIYSGCLNYDKIKKDLDWMKDIEFDEFDKKTNITIEA